MTDVSTVSAELSKGPGLIHWAALCIALTLNAGANLLLKAGATDLQGGGGLLANGPIAAVFAILLNWKLMLGLFCFAANVLFWMYALQKIPISIGYPIMVTMGFLIVLTVASLAFGETMNTMQKVGAALIIVGVCLAAQSSPPAAQTSAGSQPVNPVEAQPAAESATQ